MRSVLNRHKSLQDVEKDHIIKVMNDIKCIEKAHAVLGITKATLYRKLNLYNLKCYFKKSSIKTILKRNSSEKV